MRTFRLSSARDRAFAGALERIEYVAFVRFLSRARGRLIATDSIRPPTAQELQPQYEDRKWRNHEA